MLQRLRNTGLMDAGKSFLAESENPYLLRAFFVSSSNQRKAFIVIISLFMNECLFDVTLELCTWER